jgi:orotidine-5'-phosphate decarboxylase
MTREELFHQIQTKNSYLCVGLDADISKLPSHLLKEEDPIFEFNKQIIDATIDYTVAYKPNLAFYESQGAKGWESLTKTMAYLPSGVFTIADAKRGDIGNTSRHYARAFLEQLNFDSITLSPYMGYDAIAPYLEYENKWAIILALTSNESSRDFEQLAVTDDSNFFNIVPRRLYEMVISKSLTWQGSERIMYVVGATKADEFIRIRKLVPEHFLLVPGIGAQGGDLEEVSKNGMNNQCGLLVNSSRGIIFASQGHDFASVAAAKASAIQEQMKEYLGKYCN